MLVEVVGAEGVGAAAGAAAGAEAGTEAEAALGRFGADTDALLREVGIQREQRASAPEVEALPQPEEPTEPQQRITLQLDDESFEEQAALWPERKHTDCQIRHNVDSPCVKAGGMGVRWGEVRCEV